MRHFSCSILDILIIISFKQSYTQRNISQRNISHNLTPREISAKSFQIINKNLHHLVSIPWRILYHIWSTYTTTVSKCKQFSYVVNLIPIIVENKAYVFPLLTVILFSAALRLSAKYFFPSFMIVYTHSYRR